MIIPNGNMKVLLNGTTYRKCTFERDAISLGDFPNNIYIYHAIFDFWCTLHMSKSVNIRHKYISERSSMQLSALIYMPASRKICVVRTTKEEKSIYVCRAHLHLFFSV